MFKYDNKRYTMKDIGKLEKRINHLEYYTSLSLLEQSASTALIKDDQGHDRFKNGFLVDNFSGHAIGRVDHEDYQCAIDPINSLMRPKFESNYIDLTSAFSSGTSSGVTKTGDLITLAYTTEDFINQPQASKGVNLNPFLVTDYIGTITLSPDFDASMDTTTNPTVNVNLTGDYDGWHFADQTGRPPFGTWWNDWEILIAGLDIRDPDQINQIMNSISNEGSNVTMDNSREYDGNELSHLMHPMYRNYASSASQYGLNASGFLTIPESVSGSLGERVIDLNISPYIRALTITVSAVALKPNTRVYPFFDGTNVASVCTPSGGSAGDAIYTDSNGAISSLSFALAAGTFRTGERTFRLIDNSSNTKSSATTLGDATFQASGLIQTKQETTITTRIPKVLANPEKVHDWLEGNPDELDASS